MAEYGKSGQNLDIFWKQSQKQSLPGYQIAVWKKKGDEDDKDSFCDLTGVRLLEALEASTLGSVLGPYSLVLARILLGRFSKNLIKFLIP